MRIHARGSPCGNPNTTGRLAPTARSPGGDGRACVRPRRVAFQGHGQRTACLRDFLHGHAALGSGAEVFACSLGRPEVRMQRTWLTPTSTLAASLLVLAGAAGAGCI